MSHEKLSHLFCITLYFLEVSVLLRDSVAATIGPLRKLI